MGCQRWRRRCSTTARRSTSQSSSGKAAPAAIAKYPGKDLLMSGWLQGEQYLYNKTAAADVPLGDGHVVLLGFAVQNRAQPHGTFKLLFNSLFYSVAR